MPELALLIIVALLLSGVAVWAAAAVRLRRGQPLSPYEPRARITWNPIILTVTGFWLLLHLFRVAQKEWSRWQNGGDAKTVFDLQSVQNNCFLNTLVLAVLFLLLCEAGRRRFSEFGISLRNWRRDMATGGIGLLAVVPPTAMVLFITLPMRKAESKHLMLRFLEENSELEAVLWIGLTVVILAPLAEELVFRVILQGALRSRLGAGWSIGISTVVFAAVHGFPDFIALLPLAVALGYVYERRHSYLAVVEMHAAFNLVFLSITLLNPEQ